MGDDRKRRQDTFVVRLWRDVTSLRLLRAEVDHVQSGVHTEHRWKASNSENDPEWILDQLLKADPTQPGERSAPGPEAAENPPVAMSKHHRQRAIPLNSSEGE